MSKYDTQVSILTEAWKNDVNDIENGILTTRIQPALRVYGAHLLEDYQDIMGLAPILSDIYGAPELQDSIVGHYVGGIAFKVGTAGTSIQSTLGAINARLDCHMAIASLRRAFEAMCKVFWLLDPSCDDTTKIQRLGSLVLHEVRGTRNTWNMNAEISAGLDNAHQDLTQALGSPVGYNRKLGQRAYRQEFGSGRFSDFEWNIMCDLTHENSVFDILMWRQAGCYEERMNRAQMELTAFAIGMITNIAIFVLKSAHWPDDQLSDCAERFISIYEATRSLVGQERGPLIGDV